MDQDGMNIFDLFENMKNRKHVDNEVKLIDTEDCIKNQLVIFKTQLL